MLDICFTPNYFQKQELRLNSLLEQVLKQMENTKFTQARHAYVKLLVDKCKAGRVQSDPSDHSIRRAIFKRHNEQFSQLSPGQLSVLRSKVSAMVKNKIQGLLETKEHVQAKLRLLREREVESQALGMVNHVKSIRYGDAEFKMFSGVCFWNPICPKILASPSHHRSQFRLPWRLCCKHRWRNFMWTQV